MRRVRIDVPATVKDEYLCKPGCARRLGIGFVLVGAIALVATVVVVGVFVLPAGIVWRQKRPAWFSDSC
jgi:hypothetical protein